MHLNLGASEACIYKILFNTHGFVMVKSEIIH